MTEQYIPEVEFLRYAFPCTRMRKLRGLITDHDISYLKNAVLSNSVLPRSELERIFADASREITQLAEELGKDKWSPEVIRTYFLERHNTTVENDPDFPLDSFRNICKILDAEVLNHISDNTVTVKYGTSVRNVSKEFFPDVSIGARVRIHYDYIVDKL